MINKKIKYFLISLISVIITALLGSFFTSKNMVSWYDTLNLPSLVPSGFVFPIAWNILFILMIIAFYLILSNDNKRVSTLRKKIITLFSIQLVFNVLWVVLFFEFNWLLISLLEIVLLEITLIYLTLESYKLNKTVAYLLIPYVLWIAFATILNLSVFLIN
jgi:tryptophan-rich sensory protein